MRIFQVVFFTAIVAIIIFNKHSNTHSSSTSIPYNFHTPPIYATGLAAFIPSAHSKDLNTKLKTLILAHFYYDIDQHNPQSSLELGHLLSEHFLAFQQRDHWIGNYSSIRKPRITIGTIQDNSIAYSIDYEYVDSKGAPTMALQRQGVWTFVSDPKDSGWRLDTDRWEYDKIINLIYSNGSTFPVRNQTLSDNGNRTFDVGHYHVNLVFNNDGWETKVSPM